MVKIKRITDRFLLLFFVLISLSNFAWCQEIGDDEDFNELKKAESLLSKHKPLMDKISFGKYSLDEDQFDEIFSPCYISPFCNQTKTSVGIIETIFEDVSTGTTLVSTGTGTIIHNDLNEIYVITAKHVLEKKGVTTFTLGASFLLPGYQTLCYLAKYVIAEGHIFSHKSYDVAYAKFNLILKEQKLIGDELKKISMKINYEPIKKRTTVVTHHYPFGTPVQRLNKGTIFSDSEVHTIPTLGGSSGAPIIYNDEIVGIHTGVDEFGGGTFTFQGKILMFCKHNRHVKTSNLSVGLKSDFHAIA